MRQSILLEFKPKKPILERKSSLSGYRSRLIVGKASRGLHIPIPRRKSSLAIDYTPDSNAGHLRRPSSLIVYKIEYGPDKIVVRTRSYSLVELMDKLKYKLKREVSLYYRDEDLDLIRIVEEEDLSQAGHALVAISNNNRIIA